MPYVYKYVTPEEQSNIAIKGVSSGYLKRALKQSVYNSPEFKKNINDELNARENKSEEVKKSESPHENQNIASIPEINGEKVSESGINVNPTDQAQAESIQALTDYMAKAQEHVDEREDTAYSRAVHDMWRAGINPNIAGAISPAESKGVTGNIISGLSGLTTANINNIVDRMMQAISIEFQMDENTKDRVANIFTGILKAGAGLGGANLLAR